MISIARSFSGKPRQASMAAYRQLLAENHVEDILKDVKQNKNLDRKKELPVWLPLAASFKNGTRKAEDAQPSGLYFLDIDEKGLTEALWNKVREENLIEEFRIVYFAESAGGGTHIWAWRTPGISIEEDIRKLASRLGVSYDSHVTDLARCCFMVSEQYVKLLDPEVFEPSPVMEADQTTPPSGHPSYSGGEEDTTAGVFVSPPESGGARGGLNEWSTTYKGIPYEQIVRSLMLKMGYGEQPVEGERNNALFAMSRYMRFICDFNAGWLFQVMPHWGMADHEVMATIKSAVNSVRPNDMPAFFREVLVMLGAEKEEAQAEDEKAYSPMTIRFFILSAHYRGTVDFSNEALQAAEKGLEKLLNAIADLERIQVSDKCDAETEKVVKSLREKCYDAMNDDFATPLVISYLFEGCTVINKLTDHKATICADCLAELKATMHLFAEEILGLQSQSSKFNDQSSKSREEAFGKVVDMVLELRAKAKADKDWATSDKIRDELAAAGFEVKDTKDGVTWKLNK